MLRDFRVSASYRFLHSFLEDLTQRRKGFPAADSSGVLDVEISTVIPKNQGLPLAVPRLGRGLSPTIGRSQISLGNSHREKHAGGT